MTCSGANVRKKKMNVRKGGGGMNQIIVAVVAVAAVGLGIFVKRKKK